MLELHDVALGFDFSPPWLERLLERAPVRVLRAVDGVDFSIARGETLGLVGESGCGKSTLARLIVGLLDPTRGTIICDGTVLHGPGRAAEADVRAVRQRMQMIFQDPFASLNPRWRVRDIVGEPLQAQSLRPRAVAQRVDEVLLQVGLARNDAGRYPHQFSGGQRQRISIARALAPHPRLLICDEPTSALDVSVQAQVLNLMRDLQRDLQLTYLFISHNLAVVHHVADRVAVMYLGRIVEIGPRHRVFSGPAHPYTRLLLDAVPELAPGGRTRTAVRGEVPDALAPPSGCAFHPRCAHALERCVREVPRRLPLATGGEVACHAIEEGRLPSVASRV